MQVSRSAYYRWCRHPAKALSSHELMLYRRMKLLFAESRGSLGSRGLMKQLRKEGFTIGRYKVRILMKKLDLKVTQRVAYKVTTKRKHSHQVADNLLNQRFTPLFANQHWASDITYLRTGEGWSYLAIVMDLYSRRIVGWAVDKRMTTNLVSKATKMAIYLRRPKPGLIFHSDRGSQYTSKAFGKLLAQYKIKPSMSGKGACWDNAVVERFFGSLKHEWLANVRHLTRQSMAEDVFAYVRYYNKRRLHTANGDYSPIDYENLGDSLNNVSNFS